MYYSVTGSHAAAAKVLIDRGCQLKIKDENGHFVDDVVLTLAAKNDLTDVFKGLLPRGVFVDAINRFEETPLMVAAGAGKCDMVAFLLDQGANINGVDASKVDGDKQCSADHEDNDCGESNAKSRSELNRTPLFRALEAGRGEIAKLLVARGAACSHLYRDTNSLAKLAAMHGLSDIFHLLVDEESFKISQIKDNETLLTAAAVRGDFDSVKFPLQNGADVNAKNIMGNTAISCVFQSSKSPRTVMEIVKLLLASGADMNTRNDRWETPLLIATQKNFEEVVELLLDHGCEANIKDINSSSPLHFAARNNNGKVTAMLFQCGVDANVQDDFTGEMTPLNVAAGLNRIHAAKVLLRYGADEEVTTKFRETPHILAAKRCSLPLVQTLLEQGSNVHTKDRFGNNPLLYAVESLECGEMNESTAVVELLLDHGSVVNVTGDFGRSVMHKLPNSTTRDLCDVLIHYGADANLPDVNGETPLHLAASTGNMSYIKWLLQRGANGGASDRDSRTPLHAAAYESQSSSVYLLIQNSPDVRLTDGHGWLPLHFACARGQSVSFERLLQNGSDLTAVDNKGRTALHLAVKYGCLDLIKQLISHGSDINAKDFGGQTVFGDSLRSNLKLSDDFPIAFLRIYLENGGDIHAVDVVTGRSTLHVAVTGDLVCTVDSLLDQGLDLEARDKNGDTSLHRAAAGGTPAMIQRLVDRGADLSALNNRNQTPLLVSLAAQTSLEVPSILIKNGSNINAVDKEGNTVLHYACDASLVQILVESGGQVNAVNKRGHTPLH